MSLADDLLATAEHLARRTTKSTDGDIRRSISTAYYALFHRLIEHAIAQLVTTTDQQHALARSFEHTKMRRACDLVTKSPVPAAVAALLGAAVPTEMAQVASTFVELQERRHDADYNLGRAFTRPGARELVAAAKRAFALWDAVRTAPIAEPFLLLLLIGEPKVR